MANKMTKCGTHDNMVTYEHVCDYTSDLKNIPLEYSTLGSTAIVIHGDTGFEVYICDSNKVWVPLGSVEGGDSGSDSDSNTVDNARVGTMTVIDNGGK